MIPTLTSEAYLILARVKARAWNWIAIVAVASSIGCGDDAGGDGGGDDPDAAINVDDGGNPLPGWAALPSLPVAIQEIGVAALDGKIYTVGGFINLGAVADVHVYDIATRTWGRAQDLPAPMHHVNLAVANGKLYVVGAEEGLTFTPLDDVLEYDPAADDWTPRASLPLGFARGAAAVGVIDDIIYIAGGSTNSSVAQVSSYDPVNDVHDTTLSDLPSALNHLVGAGVGGKMYAIGGRDGGIAGIQNTTYEYDPAQDEWIEKTAMPTARGGMAAGVVDGKIIVVGGEGNSADSSGVFPQAESYDPAADTWTPVDNMLTPRHGMGAAGVGGTLYVPAGANEQLFAAVNTFESFTP